uniref:Integrase catalytic domain-containing protein n=1 Tax=Tanacetum cinerariifolium TaxID=118510 RepID=A0A6L2P0M9_TANCI|nr:hypothetical protein [Tanacetum cinerariifolium]
MNDKMKTPLWTKQNINSRPLDYSKENYLATFTPQTQLTLKQIFSSKDVLKIKSKALKEQTKASKPIKALTVYPLNTPATLVLRVLPTKSQVKINIFALIQLFLKFKKTYKKGITPTGLTEGDGFERTNECYLTEVISFFKILKEHFEGIQKALTKQIKEIKEIFKELKAEVDQNAVNRKSDEIEWKNLLIANDNLIADCLSKEVFYIATNSKLNVSIFTEMHDAHTVVQAHCLELEAELSKLNAKIQKDDHNELVKYFSNLEETRSETKRTLDFRALDFQITKLTKKVTVLQEQNELFRAENAKIKQHYKELNNRKVYLDYLKHLKDSVATLREIVEEARNDHFGAIMGYRDYVIGDNVISKVYYVEGLGHNLFSVGQFCDYDLEVAFRKHSSYVRDINGVELIKASKNKSWLWHHCLNHLNFGTINDYTKKDLVRGLARLKFEKDHLCLVCQLEKSKKHTHKPKAENTIMEVLHTLHMDLYRPMRVQIINGKKYILVIIDDYSRFTWVKFLRSKDETLEFVTKFLTQIQVGLNKTVRFIRTDNGIEFDNQVMIKFYKKVGIFHQKSVPRTPQQNGVVERHNRTLMEADWTMMIFSKDSMFLWAEVIATACYTKNRSLIHTRHNKTRYEMVHDKKPNLTFL